MKNLFKIRWIILLLPVIGLFACTSEECDCVEPPVVCSDQVMLSTELYNNGPNDIVQIIDAEIKDDSIYIEFGASGCDGSTWELCLVDAEVVMESYPEQRLIRLSLYNEELCDAYFTRKVSFDIRPTQTQLDKVILHLSGWDTPLLYEY